MSSVNKLFLLGNVGQDPEVLNTQSGTRFAKFSVATNRRWRDSQGNQQEDVVWHRITCWFDNLVNVVEQYVNGGDMIFIEGRIEYNEYEARDGTKVKAAGVVAERITLIGSRKVEGGRRTAEHGGGRGQPAPSPAPAPQSAPGPAPAPSAAPAPAPPGPAGQDQYDTLDDLPF